MKPNLRQRMPVFRTPPALGRGQAYRTLAARPTEDAVEARARAVNEKPWGPRIVDLVRTSAAPCAEAAR